MIASWTRVVAVKMETSGLFKVKMTGSSIGLQPKMEQLCTVSKNKTGSNHKLLIAKFRLKLKKVEKTTRLFRYGINKIPYDYTVEVRNRFKGLDLIDRVPDELWTLYGRQRSRPSPRKRNAKRQNGCLRRLYK